MTNETHQNQPKLSATATAAILASGTSDSQRILEAVSDIVTGMITDNERKFTAHEWQAMVSVLRDAPGLPQSLRGRARLLSLLQEAEEYEDLSKQMGISVEQLKDKVNALGHAEVACMLATLEFGLQHYPTRLGDEAWWTIEARADTAGSSTNGVVKKDRRRKENKQEKVTKKKTITRRDETSDEQSNPPTLAATNGQQKEAIAVE